MTATVHDSRAEQISRCTDEIARCWEDSGTPGDPLSGWVLGLVDWLCELHRLIHEWEDK